MSPDDRCPTCGYRRRARTAGPRQEELRQLLRSPDPPRTLAEAGERMGISRQRVHQMLADMGESLPTRRGRKPTRERARG